MLQPRPPIVVILGHVDHGKTSLLDYIRSSSVASKEAGGITQHIGAYQVLPKDASKPITFLDTPGHAAFSQMRSRGGGVADIAVLVVAATDGVMPQTKEAIQIIQELKLPFMVAATKVDLSDAQLDKLKGQLAENNVIPEDYGGDVPVLPVSSKTGQGVPELLEMIYLINELHPSTADPDGDLSGVVIESKLDKNRGPNGTVLVRNGSLKSGQEFFAEGVKCKVKSMVDEQGKEVPVALPSKPVNVLGFVSVPPIGAHVTSTDNSNHQAKSFQQMERFTNEEKTLRIILKVDVAGSLEAITSSLPEEGLQIIAGTTGEIGEADVLDAISHKARIIGFNTKVTSSASKLAEIENISIKTYSIIYELLDDIQKLIKINLHPELNEQIIGTAKVLATFNIAGEAIAGSKVLEGKLNKGDLVHVKRDDQVIGNSRIKGLKQGKVEVSEVTLGKEFGATFSPSVDFKEGDMLISYRQII